MPVGTTFFDTFLNNLQEWVDDLDLTSEMMISWVGMAEERFNNEMRVLEMVRRARIMLSDQCIILPEDFLEIISVHYTANSQPLRYISSDEYWRVRGGIEYYLSGPQTTAITYLDPATGVPIGPLPRQPAFIDYGSHGGPRLPLAQNSYTLLGKTLFVNPTVNTPAEGVAPTEIELAYYATVPPLAFAGEPTPLFKRAPKLYTFGTLAQSAPYLVEDQRATIWDSNVTALIKSMNDSAHLSRVVGSPVVMQVRSFG